MENAEDEKWERQPAFTRYHIEYSEISTYPAGYKENVGIFCHNNPWIVIGETVLGRGDATFESYRKIAPAHLKDISDLHRNEPYVYCQMIAGKGVQRITLDGQPVEGHFVSASEAGGEHRVVVTWG